MLAVVGTGYNWERSEIGLLTVGHSQSCPKVNLQYENQEGLEAILSEVQKQLAKSGSGSEQKPEDSQKVAFQVSMNCLYIIIKHRLFKSA